MIDFSIDHHFRFFFRSTPLCSGGWRVFAPAPTTMSAPVTSPGDAAIGAARPG